MEASLPQMSLKVFETATRNVIFFSFRPHNDIALNLHKHCIIWTYESLDGDGELLVTSLGLGQDRNYDMFYNSEK